MKINKLLLLFVTVFCSITITSCHDELDTVPLSTLAPENFFNNVDEAEIAVNGVYDKIAEHFQQNFYLHERPWKSRRYHSTRQLLT